MKIDIISNFCDSAPLISDFLHFWTAINKSIYSEDIKRLRKTLGLTQKEFASFAGVSHKTVERWESTQDPITGPITTLVRILWEQPGLSEYYSVPEKHFPMRLWYMHRNEICTLIDVDEVRRVVRIRNYTNRIQYRAFGINGEPSFDEYQEFLESRCFPRSGDKMKIRLQEIDVPFYDPLLIIEKTQGRMAEDEFWLQVER